MESNPIIALEIIQEKNSHDNHQIQEAAMKMEIEHAGHQWNKKFTKELLNLGYQSLTDKCVSNDCINILVIYVDSLSVIVDTEQQITEVKKELKELF